MMRADDSTADAADRTEPGRFRGARAVSIAVSVGLLAVLYTRLDVRLVGKILLAADPLRMAVSVGMILPITLALSLRFLLAAPPGSLSGFGEALKLTLVATAFNMVLPSKAGDLVKSFFLASRGRSPAGLGLAVIAYERICDMVGLILWCLVGWTISRAQSGTLPLAGWISLVSMGCIGLLLLSSTPVADALQRLVNRLLPGARFRRIRDLAGYWPGLHRVLGDRRRAVLGLSMVIWFGHLSQLWLFTVAVGATIPFVTGFSLFTVALAIAQLPFTFAGFGARDVALVVLLSVYMPAETAAAVAILAATRGVIPALAALPLLRTYASDVLTEARRWSRSFRTGNSAS